MTESACQLRHPIHAFGLERDLRAHVAVMAVVNRTPDSFFDQGRTFMLDAAIDAGRRAISEGAEIVDIGGVPFAPGPALPASVETSRVLPVVRELANLGVAISVDTFHAEVAHACLAAGARIVNDTTGLSDPRMASVVADSGAYIVLTHSLADPRKTLPAPAYTDVVTEVRDFLFRRIDRVLAVGVREDRIIVDPGLDLNKNTAHSLELVRRLDEIVALGYPVLAAPSNKDFVGESVGAPRADRSAGSLAAALACVSRGARIVRMHEVRPIRQSLDMIACIEGWQRPVMLVHNMGAANEAVDPLESYAR